MAQKGWIYVLCFDSLSTQSWIDQKSWTMRICSMSNCLWLCQWTLKGVETPGWRGYPPTLTVLTYQAISCTFSLYPNCSKSSRFGLITSSLAFWSGMWRFSSRGVIGLTLIRLCWMMDVYWDGKLGGNHGDFSTKCCWLRCGLPQKRWVRYFGKSLSLQNGDLRASPWGDVALVFGVLEEWSEVISLIHHTSRVGQASSQSRS